MPNTQLWARKRSTQEFLGFDPHLIPPITDFVDAVETQSESSALPERSTPPEWASKLLGMVNDAARQAGMSTLIVEISVLTDTLQHASLDPYFTTNIVCAAEPTGASDAPILTAYLAAIHNIAGEGTTINTPEFHALHYVHVVAPGVQLPSASTDTSPLSFFRQNVRATPLNPKYLKAGEVIDFERHHREFFEHFLAALGLPADAEATEFHYLALPFQRPTHLTDLVDASRPPSLEPAGALYLIMRRRVDLDANDATDGADIATLAARLQYVCTQACLSASSLIADKTSMTAAISEARLHAYDGIGHALRAFVEATNYKGMLAVLSDIESDLRVPPEIVVALTHVRRSVAFFEHAEALGSLMRLHSWLSSTNGDRQTQLRKVIDCYDRDELYDIQDGIIDGRTIAAAAADVLRRLAATLAYKDQVSFQIRYLDKTVDSAITLFVAPESTDAGETQVPTTLPPLRNDGDARAVFLAVVVAMLEPLRNASMHLRGRQPPSIVEVLIAGASGGAVTIYIGNRWHNPVDVAANVLSLSGGMRLIEQLLRECHLGGYFTANVANIRAELGALLERGHSYQNYIWVGLTLDPLRLYNFAEANL